MLIIYNLLILFNILFFLSKADIINNPILLTNHGNPILLQDGSYYFIYTSGEVVIINKSTSQITTSPFGTYAAPYLFIIDESNNYYVYGSNAMYKVIIPNSYTTVTKPSIDFPTSSIFVGYLKETQYTTSYINLFSCLSSVEQDEIIIYGKKGSAKLVFSFLKKSVAYTFSFTTFSELEDKMACRVVSNSQYVCVIVGDYTVYALLIMHIVS